VAIDWLQHGSLPSSLVSSLVAGVGGAAAMSAVGVSQMRQRYRHVLAAVDLPATRSQALGAAMGGPVPADPVVRHIAATLAAIRAQSFRERRRRLIIMNSVVAALMAAATVWAPAAGSPRQALLTGLLGLWSAGNALLTPWAARRATHRQALLAGPTQSPPLR